MVADVLDQLRGLGMSVRTPEVPRVPQASHRVPSLEFIFLEMQYRSSVALAWMVYSPKLAFKDVPTIDEISRLQHEGLDVLLAADLFNEKTAEAFRRSGLWYCDSAGNANLKFGEVLIDIRGRKAVTPVERSARPTRSENLFSTKRSQVVFSLLAWPYLGDLGYRKIAEAAGVSVGQAHETMQMLEQMGYLSNQRLDTFRYRDLLEYWAASFASGLSRSLELGSFEGDPHRIVPASEDEPVFLSGERAAAKYLRPGDDAIIYVNRVSPRLIVNNRWRSSDLSNITVRKKFWLAPDNSDEWSLGERFVPWPLVYADLISSDDPRQVAAAAELLDEHVARRI